MITDFSTVNPKAVFRAYPTAVSFRNDTGAFDADGNSVELDEAVIAAATVEQISEDRWSYLREKRNQLLAKTDWWANSDVTMTDEQRAYRQALRDLPANTVDPENPVWPTKPE